MSKVLKSLKTNLPALMNAQRLSQAALSRNSGVPQSHISQYIAGKTKPGLEALESLADALGVPVSAIIGDEVPTGSPRPAPEERLRLEIIQALFSADRDKLQPAINASRQGNRVVGITV